MNKKIFVILTMFQMLFVASCSGWVIQPGASNPPTPFLPPTNTPSIFTATPVVVAASATSSPVIPTSTPIQFITATSAPTQPPLDTPVTFPTQTSLPSAPSVSVEILGCNTSIDVLHGMGEVTNAFVIIRNTGGSDLTNLQVTLNALDEGREHPDKTVDVTSLPAGHNVTLKLTVDSTYRAETPIQIEVRADGGLFQRVGAESCKDIGLFAPNPGGLNTPAPNNP